MRRIFLVVLLAGIFDDALPAQSDRTPEPLSDWRYFKEIQTQPASSGLLDFVLDREALDQARTDQADLRLYDGAGREIPYILRVRRDVATSNALPAREFNRGVEGAVAQVSFDLGEQTQQNNEVEVETAGNNFRRLVEVQGSADGVQWSTLVSGAIVFRFVSGDRNTQQQSVAYPVSRYRYLRIRVTRDPQVDALAPGIMSVRIRRSVQMQGESVSFTGTVEGREADRVNSRPASIWRVDLGGRVPLQRVTFNVGEGVFSRPFRLEAVDDPAAAVLLSSGELTRRPDAAAPPAVEFPEQFARRLKLTVTDDRNLPLPILGITAWGAARQVIFELSPTASGPIRLYYGNPKALAPRYDLSARVPAEMRPSSSRLTLGPRRDNPIYRPQPQPFSERSPWLIYVVLGAASIALAAILINLARTKG